MIQKDLRNIITEAVREYLMEAATSLSDIYKKHYSDIPEKDFFSIIQLDPTYKPEQPDKMGKFGKWILSQYQRKLLKKEDFYKVKDYLHYFVKYYNKIQNKDINQYKSIQDLFDVVKPFKEAEEKGDDIATSKSDEVRQIKQDVKKVYEDPNWLILIPLTKEAAIYYGKHTQWCTAATKSENMFDYYNNQGPLYINIDKRNNRKYQFHFQSAQFKDENDRDIVDPVAETIGMDKSVIKKVYPNYILQLNEDSSIISLTNGVYIKKTDIFYIDSNTNERITIIKTNKPVLDAYIKNLGEGYYWINQGDFGGILVNTITKTASEQPNFQYVDVYHRKDGNVAVCGNNAKGGLFAALFQNGKFTNTYYFRVAGVFMLLSSDGYEEIKGANRYVCVPTGEEDIANEDVFDIFDLETMEFVLKSVVYDIFDGVSNTSYRSDANGNEECFLKFRDAVTSSDVYDSMYNDDYSYDDEDDEEEDYEWEDTQDDLLINAATRYEFSESTGEIKEVKPDPETTRVSENRLSQVVSEIVQEMINQGNLINETQLLRENKLNNARNAAIKYAMSKGYTYDEAKNLIAKIRSEIFILQRNNIAMYFIEGITRIYIDEDLEHNSDLRNKLNAAMAYVISNEHIKDFDRNLNNNSAEGLYNLFKDEIDRNHDMMRNEISSMKFEGGSDYDIVRIDDFEQASQYYEPTKWCITEEEETFDKLSAYGDNQFYFCLKKGFESIPKEVGANCPLDEYGLSMIAVLVDPDGRLLKCTCRWNHEHGGNDGVMNEAEISRVIGMNFYDVFKPNDNWKNLLDNAMQRIKNGENPRLVFDYCEVFHNGYAAVKLNEKWNWIDTEGNLFSPNQWFDLCGHFKDGYAKVELNDKWNFMDTKGVFLYKKPIDQWFDWCGDFYYGYASVNINDKSNFIDTKCNFLFDLPIDRWFDWCGNFNEGYAFVERNNKYNFIDTEGNFLYNVPMDQWFDWCSNFKDGCAVIRIKGKFNLIGLEGNFLYDAPFKQWFDNCDPFHDGYARVELNDRYNFIDTKGNLLCKKPVNQWFEYCEHFRNGYTKVQFNGKWRAMDTEGNLYNAKTLRRLKKNVNTVQTNESIRNSLTDTIVENLMNRIIV